MEKVQGFELPLDFLQTLVKLLYELCRMFMCHFIFLSKDVKCTVNEKGNFTESVRMFQHPNTHLDIQ